jgi:serine protease
MAPRLQDLLRGIGTNGELWSAVMTQYCEGVAAGATVCPAGAPHVGYPGGGALAGVWLDRTAAAPASATDHELAVEAIAAAAHFGNTTAASNRSAQYVVVSPTGTTPGGFNTVGHNWCAWHDWNRDPTLGGGAAVSPYGDIAFTNLPYLTDKGASCGMGYVNSPGTLDGISIVEGHEYAETVTDQNAGGGWYDSTGNENADKCAWIGVGAPGGAENVTLATGSFPLQATFSNDGNACLISHAIVGAQPSSDYAMSLSPAATNLPSGTSATIAVATTAAVGVAQAIALTASGLPPGVTAAFAPAVVTAGQGAVLTLTASGSATVGSYVIGVTGAASAATHSATAPLTVTASGTLPGSAPCVAVDTAGIAAWWRGDGTTSPAGPVFVGPAPTTAAHASLGFNSTNTTVLTATGVAQPTTGLTLEMWLRPSSNSGMADQPLISRWSGPGFSSASDDSHAYNLEIWSNSYIVFATDDNSTEYPIELRVAAPQLFDGSFHHLAAVWTPATITLYLDGNEIGTRASQGGQLQTGAPTPVRLGPYAGVVDEPTIWTRALSAAEIKTIASAPGTKC